MYARAHEREMVCRPHQAAREPAECWKSSGKCPGKMPWWLYRTFPRMPSTRHVTAFRAHGPTRRRVRSGICHPLRRPRRGPHLGSARHSHTRSCQLADLEKELVCPTANSPISASSIPIISACSEVRRWQPGMMLMRKRMMHEPTNEKAKPVNESASW